MQSANSQNTKTGSSENNDTSASFSDLIDPFPLPFQEVNGHSYYGTNMQSHDISVPQESWHSYPLRNHAYATDEPSGFECSLDNNDNNEQDSKQAPPFALSPPLPLQRKPPPPECHEDNSGTSQQKQQSTSMLSCHRGGKSPTPPSGNDVLLLPEDFTPHKWSVRIGRDKKSVESPGNKRLHIIIGWYLERYAKSHKDREAKSSIISEIESTVRSACQGERGAFIKYSNGRWWEIEVAQVREKISRMIREALSTSYSSSTKQKRAKRRQLKRAPPKDNEEASSSSQSV